MKFEMQHMLDSLDDTRNLLSSIDFNSEDEFKTFHITMLTEIISVLTQFRDELSKTLK
jgi:Mor family transcriptional regulator